MRRAVVTTPRPCPAGGMHYLDYGTPKRSRVTGKCRKCGFTETIPNWTPDYSQLTTLREVDFWERLWGALQQRQGVF